MQPEQEIINRWTGSAPYWEKHRAIIRQMFDPVTRTLLEEAQIGAGQMVLDVATGPGEPALSVAGVVGPEGKVFGVDPVPEMVAAARRETERQGKQNVQFNVGFADKLAFPANTFDAVISRFGVMFFPAPIAAVREMLRVLKPGGKLALAVWHLAEKNPFHSSLSRVVDRYVPSPPLAPDALDAFRFASPGKLRQVLVQAGVLSPSERVLQFTIEATIAVQEFLNLRLEMSEKLREKMARLSKDQINNVKREALKSLSQYANDRGMSFPAEVLLLSGAKERAT